MKKAVRVLSVILALILCISLLCACNKDKEEQKQRERRDRATASVVEAFMSGVNENWTTNLDDNGVAKLEEPGDYVTTIYWTKFVCDVMSRGNINTSKIEALATALNSTDGRKMLSAFEENAQLLIPILKEVGFTATDISGLVIDLMKSIANDGATVFDGINERLAVVKELARNNQNAYDNILDAISLVSTAKAVFMPTQEEKTQFVTAIDEATNAIENLVNFSYNMSIESITQDLFDTLFAENGALGDISNSELSTLVGAIMQNVRNLKAVMTEQEIAKLNVALDLVIKKFDTDMVSSAIYAQIVKYAKYAYIVVDIIPTVCDFVVASGDTIANQEFLNSLKLADECNDTLNEDTKKLNSTIIVAKILQGVLSQFDAQSLATALDKVGAQGVLEYQKAVPIMAVDLMLNFNMLLNADDKESIDVVHADIIDVETMKSSMALVLFFNGGFDKFREDYAKFCRGEIDAYALRDSGNLCSFERFGVQNPYHPITQTEAWYKYYVVEGVKKVNEFVKTAMPKVIADIKAFANDYYTAETGVKGALQTIASWNIFTQNVDEDMIASEYAPTIQKAYLSGIWMLMPQS